MAPRKLYLRLDSMEGVKWPGVKVVLETQPGDTPVYLYPMDKKKKVLAARRLWVRADLPILQKLRFLLGEENVIMQ